MTDLQPPTPSTASSSKSSKGFPLLSLAPPALALGEELSLGEDGDETSVRDIWTVITRTADLVKDGQRLENLAWRWNWGQRNRRRRSSVSSASIATGSSVSLHTPSQDHYDHDPPYSAFSASPTSPRVERRTFGGALKLLLEEDSFKDWVMDAKLHHHVLPEISIPSVPDTPIADVEIRLVEPTPVPSRVGSLGGSMSGAGLLSAAVVPRTLAEDKEAEAFEEEEEEIAGGVDEQSHHTRMLGAGMLGKPSGGATPSRTTRKAGKFFLHSSPTKGSGGSGGSGSESNNPSPVSPVTANLPSPEKPPQQIRRSSESSSGGNSSTKLKGIKGKVTLAGVGEPPNGFQRGAEKPRQGLSAMRGKFHSEKRKAAAALEAKNGKDAKEEESGWEDDDEEAEEDWSDEDDGDIDGRKSKRSEDPPIPTTSPINPALFPSRQSDLHLPISKKPQAHPPPNANTKSPRRPSASKEMSRSRSRSKSGHSTSNLDLTALLTRTKSRTHHNNNTPPREPPNPPAPTPLRKMSKKERQKAAQERARIEAELEAQRKREMFAKQQIFGGRPAGEGLLSGMFKSGGSMVNLMEAKENAERLRPSPTHGHLPSLTSLGMGKSPVGPSLLRSKSAVAMPVQTGVSVTRVSPHKSKLSEEISSLDSEDHPPPPAAARSAERNRAGPSNSKGPGSKGSKGSKGSSEKRGPTGVIMESSDEDSDEDDDYLATSSTKRKIAELAAKKDAKAASISPIAAQPVPHVPPLPVNINEQGVVQPLSPTTRRRAIIMREMSESLRRNLILEREKSSGGAARINKANPGAGSRKNSLTQAPHARLPPSTHTSVLPARGSSTNLAQYHRDYQNNNPPQRVFLARHKSDPSLPSQVQADPSRPPTVDSPEPIQDARVVSPDPPNHHPLQHRTIHHHHQHHHHDGRPLPPHSNHPQAADPVRRRTQPNVLGGGFLRPLTRVGNISPNVGNGSVGGGLAGLGRTQSSNNLMEGRSISPVATSLEAPAMMRRSTEGPDMEREQRRRELAQRSLGTDTSYRTHGW